MIVSCYVSGNSVPHMACCSTHPFSCLLTFHFYLEFLNEVLFRFWMIKFILKKKRLILKPYRDIASGLCQNVQFHICELTRSRVTFPRAVENHLNPLRVILWNFLRLN